MQNYHVQSCSAAEPETIYSMLLDGPSWPLWMAVDEIAVDQVGVGKLGEVRRVTAAGRVGYERIVRLVPDRHFSYVNEGAPFTMYHGEIELTPTPGGGTRIEWKAQFSVRPAVLAWPMKLFLTRYMQRTVTRLARAAELSVAPDAA